MRTIRTMAVTNTAVWLPEDGTQCAETCWCDILNALCVFSVVHLLV
jgi:hypothetical protein